MVSKSIDRSSPSAKAPVTLTGGMGFRFENQVAARLMLDMLGATNILGDQFGSIIRLDWQTRDSGWLADDIAATCQTKIGTKIAALSLKSGQSVTPNGFPGDFVELAWHQWKRNGTTRELQNTNDVIVLVTGDGKASAETPWNDLLSEILAGDASRVVERLNSTKEEGSQSSKEKRAIFSSFKPTPSSSEMDEETVRLLSHVRWHNFDFQNDNSRAKLAAINDCKSVLDHSQVHRADDLWKQLTELADELRPLGGTITLPKLYERLKGFRFKAKVEVEGDWKLLDRRTELETAAIKSNIGGQTPIDRSDQRNLVKASLDSSSICLMVGDSGSGKSALAKDLGKGFQHVVWLTAETCDHPSLPDLERSLGLSQNVCSLIDATPEDSCVIFDAIEGFGGNALKVTAQLITSIQKTDSGKRTKILLTTQTSASSVIIQELIKAGFPKDLVNVVPIDRPDESSVRVLASNLPKVGWIALSPDVRALLRNLKMLDWFVDFAESGGVLDSANVGLTNLIDSIWDHWVAVGGDKYARSGLLQTVASIEADRHIASVPVAELDTPKQITLGTLTGGDLLRVQSNRIRFAHDLISDWARYNLLLDGDWLSTKEKRERYIKPRWARAVRLYAQRLLEQGNDGGESWRKHLEVVRDGSPTDTLIRDLFLEALFLAPNAEALIKQAWPTLIANKGELLGVMLKRFLYAATYPDPRLPYLLPPEEDITEFEHLMRVPYWPYWGPVISVLHEHQAEVVEQIPVAAAKLVSLWLRTMNFEPSPGHRIKWRDEAAGLALAAGRKIQSFNEQGNYYSGGSDKDVYEAVLQAAPELPDEVGQLCLELAHRRDLSPEIAAIVAEAHAAREAERKKSEAENPRPRRRSVPASFPLGTLRTPWPDGPSERVDQDFQDAILDGGSFGVFAKANPVAALETLLAVCIEEPKYEYSGSSLGEYGLSWWQKGDPASWFRGPFYAFLNGAPEQGLSFVIRLTNFVTSQFPRHEGLTFEIDGAEKFWRGDHNFFAAHYDGYISHGSIVQSALMALEKWLYDKLDRSEDITPYVTRIMTESESVTFAGLLTTVGKRKPDLFLGALRPLLDNWVVWNWDFQHSLQRANGMRGPMGFIRNEGQHAFNLLRDWVSLPHRKESLRDLMCREYLPQENFRPVFATIRKEWQGKLEKNGTPDHLAQLIALIDPANYTFQQKDGKLLSVGFTWPKDQQAKAQGSAKSATRRMQYLTFPSKCRKLLDEKPGISGEDLNKFLDLLKDFHADREAAEDSDGLHTKEDLVMGGVAVLVVLAYDWLAANPKALKWCAVRLKEENDSQEARPRFYHDTNIGNDKRDAFGAEAAIALLARNPSDKLARSLTARGILAFFYSTTSLAVDKAAANRKALGDDFARIIRLAVEWSALRSKVHSTLNTMPNELSKQLKERGALHASFVSGKLPTTLPDLSALNAATSKALEDLYYKGHPEQAAFRQAARHREQQDTTKQAAERLGLDERLLRATFGWVSLANAETPQVRVESIATTKSLLGLVLGRLPSFDANSREELEGFPSDFDTWVFGLVSEAIVEMTDIEKPEQLWQPILGLGPHANDWVERFFVEWFTRGYRARSDLTLFVRRWRQMIEYALANPRWDPKAAWHSRIDDIAKELLGLNVLWSPFKEDGFGPHVLGLTDLFEKAAAKWLYLPDVLNAFVHAAQKPAAASLALKSIPWIAAVTADYHDYSWRYGLEEGMISFLGVCWKLGAKEISADAKLQSQFFQLMNAMVARQSHAAIALRDRVAQQTQS